MWHIDWASVIIGVVIGAAIMLVVIALLGAGDDDSTWRGM